MHTSLVIIPTYNEIENIDLVLQKIIGLPISFSILIVDDNSPDGTANRVKELQRTSIYKEKLFLLERQAKQGLGTAYIEGFTWGLSKGYACLFEMDADLSHNPKDLVRMQKQLDTHTTDVVIGSRYVTGVNVVNWSMSRVLLSWGASQYVQFILQMGIKDTTAGFVGYKRAVLEKINLDKIAFVGYAFQIEMKYKAYLLGFSLSEIPVIFTDRMHGTSKMNTSIISEAVFGVLKLRTKALCKRLV